MGLKWFRARLSMEKEASKVPALTGTYRRISCFESVIQKNAEVSAAPPSVTSDSMASDDNEIVEYDRSKVDLTSHTSASTIDSEEMMVKNNDEKSWINNYAVENAEPSTSTKDLNVKWARNKKSNKLTKDQDDMADTKSPICLDNELVI